MRIRDWSSDVVLFRSDHEDGIAAGKPRQRHDRRALHAGTAIVAARRAAARIEAPRMTTRDPRDAAALAAAVNDGTSSAVAIAGQTLGRLAAYDAIQPQIWISRMAPDDLLAAARAVDARVAAGETLPLAGVPYAVKDNIDVELGRAH